MVDLSFGVAALLGAWCFGSIVMLVFVLAACGRSSQISRMEEKTRYYARDYTRND